ncbi:MAG: hypothetical protein V2A79_02345 [Planctomycetota bacterium]
MATNMQTPYSILNQETEALFTLAPTITRTFGPFPTEGYAQLVGSVRADQPVSVYVEGAVLATGATWDAMDHKAPLVTGQVFPIVVNLTKPHIRIRVVGLAAGATANVEINGWLLPVSALSGREEMTLLSEEITLHHTLARAVGDGTDADLEGAYAGGRIQIVSNADLVSATLQFFGSVDGTNFVPIQCRNEVTNVIANNTVIGASANEVWLTEVAGYQTLRVRIEAIDIGAGMLGRVTVLSKIIEAATPETDESVVNLETVETTHHASAAAIANGTDAILSGAYSGGRFQIVANVTLVSATLLFLGSEDGINFVAVKCRREGTDTYATQTAITANSDEIWVVETAGLRLLRVRVDAINTGGGGLGRVVVTSKIIQGASPQASQAVVDLETKETVHHALANAVANGTDAVLDGSFSGGRIQIDASVGIVAATVQFFGSADGVTFAAMLCRNSATGVIAAQTTLAGPSTEVWEAETVGLRALRCRLDAINPAAGIPTVSVISKIIEGATPDILKSWNEGERAKVSPIAGQAGVQGGSGATTALTQRVVVATDNPTYGAPAVAAPSYAEQVGGRYSAVPPAVADGQLGAFLEDAYRRLEISMTNRVAQAIQMLEVAPWVHESAPVTLRASAAMPAAGALDAVPAGTPTGDRVSAYLTFLHTAAVIGGKARVIIELCDTVAAVDKWGYNPQIEAQSAAEGADGVFRVQRLVYDFPATSLNQEVGRLAIPLGGADMIRIRAQEAGVIASPGTLEVVCKFSNHPVSTPVVFDSRGWVSGQAYWRMGETNPLSAQYVNESAYAQEAIASNAAIIIPSAAGSAMAGFKDVDFEIYLNGGIDAGAIPVTASLIISGWNDTSTGGLHPIIVPVTPDVWSRRFGTRGFASFSSTGNTPYSDILSLANLNCAFFRIDIAWSGTPAAGNPGKVCVYPRRKAL